MCVPVPVVMAGTLMVLVVMVIVSVIHDILPSFDGLPVGYLDYSSENHLPGSLKELATRRLKKC